ncbi:cupin domain-containing protein [Fusibacter sp. JL298sf-3]
MIVSNMKDTKKIIVDNPQVKNAAMQVLVSPQEGWDGYVMRAMELTKDGYTPKHQHDWPHINYVIEGEGSVLIDDTVHPLTAGSYAYVPSNALHQYRNTGDATFKFLCIVPEEGHK